ncbi:hypothetical protein [Longimicrobium sp.]|uniref:hypothetical protein n=1 Tax=Longimicrobium sp. TaxID=2029185 RepID=UPI002E302AAC|nr:hypothetical protein [Longimicrobium sp.]HEX6041014.1 hypothetical protein [Longimicrobium sp.]
MAVRTRRRLIGRVGFSSLALLTLFQAGSADTQVTQEPQQCFRYIDEPVTACSTCASLCYGKGYKCCGVIIIQT